MTYNLPVDYTKLKPHERKTVREQYVKEQKGLCFFCAQSLDDDPPKEITDKQIWWKQFPPGFLKNPIHLQHDHISNLTEGAVHAYCNAVWWQFYGR